MDSNPLIPFTFVEVEESMYNFTLERLKHLVSENDRLKKDVGALDTLVSKLDTDLERSESEKRILIQEVQAWRKWSSSEPDTFNPEPLLWQEVVNCGKTTDTQGLLDKEG